MRFLIDDCFKLSVPAEEHKLKLSLEYVWKAAFLTMDHLYDRYPRCFPAALSHFLRRGFFEAHMLLGRLLVGVHSVTNHVG